MFLVRCDVPLVNTLNKREQPVDDVWSTVQALRCCPSQPAPPWPDVLSGLPWRTDGKQPLNDGNVPRWRCFEGCRRLRGNICNSAPEGYTNAAHTQTGRPTHCLAAPAHVRAQKQQPYQSQQPLPRGSKRQRKCTHTNTQRSPTKYGAGSRRSTCNRGSSIHTVPRHRASARARFR